MKQVNYFLLILFFVMQSCLNSKSYNYSIEDAQLVIDIDSVRFVSLKIGDIRYQST
jgi:hypothetical protein